jgi:glycosyltransferase involved in cell wall biosynthesis
VTRRRFRVTCLIGQTGIAGAERQLLNFFRHRDRERFEYQLIVLNSRAPYTFDDEIRAAGVEVIQVPATCQGVGTRIRFLLKVLRSWRPDVFHSWSFYATPYVALVGRLARVPVLLTSMRNDPDAAWGRGLRGYIGPVLAKSVHGIVVNSQVVRRKVSERWVAGKKVHLVENCVEVTPTHTDPTSVFAELGIPWGVPVVGMVANFHEEKNHGLFIRAMARVVARVPDVRAIIIGREIAGEPDVFPGAQALVAELGLEDEIVFAGPRRDAQLLLLGFDVFCLTSRNEGTPNVLIEAMAMGRAVVSTPAGEVPLLIDNGVTGVLVDFDDAQGMAEQIVRLLGDPRSRALLGENARKAAMDKRSCQAMANSLERVYFDHLRSASDQRGAISP